MYKYFSYNNHDDDLSVKGLGQSIVGMKDRGRKEHTKHKIVRDIENILIKGFSTPYWKCNVDVLL